MVWVAGEVLGADLSDRLYHEFALTELMSWT